MDGRRARREGGVFADVAAIPSDELESRNRGILAGADWRIRRRAYFWFVRFARAGGGEGLRGNGSALCRGADRNVSADCAERADEANLPPVLRKEDAGERGARDCDVRAGD